MEKDYDPEIDDDLEGDFYKDCTSVCSMVVGTTKRQLLPTLDLPCLRKFELYCYSYYRS